MSIEKIQLKSLQAFEWTNWPKVSAFAVCITQNVVDVPPLKRIIIRMFLKDLQMKMLYIVIKDLLSDDILYIRNIIIILILFWYSFNE